jgi:hypothetical protein
VLTDESTNDWAREKNDAFFILHSILFEKYVLCLALGHVPVVPST